MNDNDFGNYKLKDIPTGGGRSFRLDARPPRLLTTGEDVEQVTLKQGSNQHAESNLNLEVIIFFNQR